MTKQNVTLSVDSDMYLNFRQECLRKNVKFGEQLEKFMQGFSQNHKINDFLTYEETQNPKIDIPIEEMTDLLLTMDTKRAQELLYKVDEWQVRLLKK